MSQKIVAILGSYHKKGIIHQSVALMAHELKQQGIEVEIIDLLDKRIEFCTNCRSCMQNNPDSPRGICITKDDMSVILDSIEQADSIILASPINMYAPTALMKRFTERLSVYGYWPWETMMPKMRKQPFQRKILVLTSSGAPAFIVKLLASWWNKQLTTLAQNGLNAKKVKALHLGKVAYYKAPVLDEKQKKKILKAGKFFIK